MQKRRRDINEALDVSLCIIRHVYEPNQLRSVKSEREFERRAQKKVRIKNHRPFSLSSRSSNHEHDFEYVFVGKAYGMRSHHGSTLTRLLLFFLFSSLFAFISWLHVRALTHSSEQHTLRFHIELTLNVCIWIYCTWGTWFARRSMFAANIHAHTNIVCFQQFNVHAQFPIHLIQRCCLHNSVSHVICRIECDLINVLMTNLLRFFSHFFCVFCLVFHLLVCVYMGGISRIVCNVDGYFFHLPSVSEFFGILHSISCSLFWHASHSMKIHRIFPSYWFTQIDIFSYFAW